MEGQTDFGMTCQEMQKRVWPTMTEIGSSSFNFTHYPSMHHKWKEIIEICVPNNHWKVLGDQLSAKCPIELKYNFTDQHFHALE